VFFHSVPGNLLAQAKRTPWQIQQAVIFALLMREIKTRFGTHWSGIVWVIGLPLLQMGVLVTFNLVSQGLLSRGGFDYLVFLVVAYVPFRTCTELWTQLPAGIGANRGLFSYRQVKPFDTLIARTVLESVIDLVVLALLLLLIERIGVEGSVLPNDPLAFVLCLGQFIFLGTGVGLVMACAAGVLPKLPAAVGLLSMPLLLMSGVVSSLHAFPQDVIDALLYNPLLHLVELARAAYMLGYTPLQGVNAYFPAVVGLVFWVFGMSLYRVRRRRMATE
jgi:capsular polysaccharide transport system permease protein